MNHGLSSCKIWGFTPIARWMIFVVRENLRIQELDDDPGGYTSSHKMGQLHLRYRMDDRKGQGTPPIAKVAAMAFFIITYQSVASEK